ncbi:HD family phosphohydrolase [Prevotella sp. 885]|uniref:HD family phosphohydrolase n=1 Tax=Prevotella sp. 885 TaxID=2022527 RepID=UPI000BA0AA16|nr:HDIG domain-containing metalloprotein [Prevotella sp. 885]OZT04455.1 hydrolase [Prevotella sp. 885]
MEKFYSSRKLKWRNFLSRTLLVLITVLLIVWALPRNESKQFRYDIGKPWMYGSFIAKFDFPIYKTDETIKEQEDSLLETYQPYYNYDPAVEKKQVSKFLADYQNGIPGLPHNYVRLIADRLHRLYQAGIMDTPEYNEAYRDSTSQVRLVSGNSAQSISLGCVYSTLSAYEQLFIDEQIAMQRPILQRCNLNNYIEPNLIYDKGKSETERNDLLSSIPPASGMVMSGQKVIDRGDIVDEYTYRVLSSFEREIKRRSATQTQITNTIIGQVIFVTLMVFLFTMYLGLFRRDYFNKPRSIAMLYTLITLFPVVVSLMMRHNFLSVYMLPFAMVPIFVRVFMDSRTAFVCHVTMILICTTAVRYQYEFIIIQLVAGLIAIYSLRELTRRAQVFKTAILVGIGSTFVYLALQLMQDNDFSSMDHDMYYHFVVNAVLLLIAYPMMYIIEKMFGFVSSVTLFELSNTNRGLLRDLSEIAPGTFQHSITVGNLAAEIANKIGANALLVRTGALYHDIGKMKNPVFFTENQAGVNPHDTLTYQESARIIISHVTEGVKLAERENLPTIIRDFIVTHHGTGITKFFYIKYKNEHPEEEVDPAPFTYPGPNPFTREQAILMIADGVEAASRSLPEYTEESISTLVNRMIDQDVTDGYFKECPITFRDLAIAKLVLIERLKAIYHTRISYPEMKKASEEEKN